MPQQSCSNCKFVWFSAEGELVCLWAPPQTLVVPGKGNKPAQIVSRWPRIDEDHWCGQWRARRDGYEA